VPHRLIWSWYTGRWWVGCYIWYSDKGTQLTQAPVCCTKCNSPPINGQCTDHCIAVKVRYSVGLMCPLKGWTIHIYIRDQLLQRTLPLFEIQERQFPVHTNEINSHNTCYKCSKVLKYHKHVFAGCCTKILVRIYQYLTQNCSCLKLYLFKNVWCFQPSAIWQFVQV